MRISDWSSDVCSSDLGLQGASLSQAIKAAKEQGKAGLFNQVGQVWNHSFYWLCLSPEKQAPTGKLLEMINESYGSVDDFLAKFKAEAVGHFASGWAWLVLRSEEHTSELQSLMRISYAVFCLKKKKKEHYVCYNQ